MMRVVSLVPSATETLLAWSVDVVACTRFCEQPSIAHVGGTKDPDVAAIVDLHPDLVVVDREENRREDADALAAAGLDVHVMHVTSLATVGDELRALGARVGVANGIGFDQGEPDEPWATAFVPIWRRPWMTIDTRTFGSSVLAHLGVVNVVGESSTRYPVVELADVAPLAPDLVLLPSEPYPFRSRHVAEIAAALPGADIRMIDGQDLFWWGTRTPAALARLREVLRAGPGPR